MVSSRSTQPEQEEGSTANYGFGCFSPSCRTIPQAEIVQFIAIWLHRAARQLLSTSGRVASTQRVLGLPGNLSKHVGQHTLPVAVTGS